VSTTRTSTLSSGVRAKLATLGVKAEHVGRIVNTAATADADPPVVIPDTPAGLEEMMHDAARMKALFKQKDGFANFVREYAKAIHNKDQEIATQVREETQRVLADWLKDNKELDGAQPVNLNFNSAANAPSSTDARNGLFNPKAMGAPLDKEFKDAAEFFSLIWHNRQRDAQAQAQFARVRNAFSSTVPSEGGFLIPETLRSELLRVSLETSIVRPRARVIPMETLRVPFPAIDDTSHSSSVYGGIVGYWTEEGAALTQSQASFGRVVLDAKKLTAYTEVPNELVSDSITSFQAFIDQIFPEALGFYEDVAFISGSGVGEPLGYLNGAANVSVARTGGGNAVEFTDIVNMYTRMLPSSLNRAVWIVSPAVIGDLLRLALTVAAGDSVSPPLWLTGSQAISGPTLQLLGRPVLVSEKVPNLASAGDISFVDFGFYLVGDRQVMSAMSSPHFKFQNDMTAYRIIERLDGRPWLNSALTPKNGGPTLSPFVTLAA
jgi:HK97 family phage major capsid protein